MFIAKRLFFHHDGPTAKSLMLNSVSGAFDLLPTELARQIELHKGKPAPDDLLNILGDEVKVLKTRGYLFDTVDAEEKKLQELRQTINEVEGPLTKFVICPTYTCNLACTYCYEGALTRQKGVISSKQLELIIEAIDVLKKRPGVRRYLYELFGGEPLLPSTYKVVAQLLAELEKREDTLAIVTNGTHISQFLPLFRKHPSVIESIQITIDGPKRLHDRRRIDHAGNGSFDLIVDGVDQLLRAGFFVRLRVNVDRENLRALPELFTFIERREWTMYRHFTCDVAPVTYHTKAVQSDAVMREDEIVSTILDELPELMRPQSQCQWGMFRVLNHATSVLEAQRSQLRALPLFTYCEATEGSIYVFGADGRIYTCPDSIINPKWAVGRYDPTFELNEELVNLWRRDIFSIPKCRDCEIATFCGGGCALVSMEERTDTPFCNGARETLSAYLSSWFRRRFPISSAVTVKEA